MVPSTEKRSVACRYKHVQEKNCLYDTHLQKCIHLPGEVDWSRLCVGPGGAPSDWHESGRT